MALLASLLGCLSVPSVIFPGDLILCLTGIACTLNRKSSEIQCGGKYDLVCKNAAVVGVG